MQDAQKQAAMLRGRRMMVKGWVCMANDRPVYCHIHPVAKFPKIPDKVAMVLLILNSCAAYLGATSIMLVVKPACPKP